MSHMGSKPAPLVDAHRSDSVECSASPRLWADQGDPHHVGRARGAERHAGDHDDALAGRGEAVLDGDAAGAVDHVVLVMGILGEDAVDAPHQRELAGPVAMFGEIDTIGAFGRSRATRSAVAPDEVQHTRALRSSVSAISRAAAAMASAPVASGATRWASMMPR